MIVTTSKRHVMSWFVWGSLRWEYQQRGHEAGRTSTLRHFHFNIESSPDFYSVNFGGVLEALRVELAQRSRYHWNRHILNCGFRYLFYENPSQSKPEIWQRSEGKKCKNASVPPVSSSHYQSPTSNGSSQFRPSNIFYLHTSMLSIFLISLILYCGKWSAQT